MQEWGGNLNLQRRYELAPMTGSPHSLVQQLEGGVLELNAGLVVLGEGCSSAAVRRGGT
jgi:hypothetical protein